MQNFLGYLVPHAKIFGTTSKIFSNIWNPWAPHIRWDVKMYNSSCMNALFVFRIASFDGIFILGEVGSIIFRGGCNCVLLRSDCLEIHDNLMAVREIQSFFKVFISHQEASKLWSINKCLPRQHWLLRDTKLIGAGVLGCRISLDNLARGYQKS